MSPILFATTEYPPDLGGVSEYLAGLAGAIPAGDAVVLAPARSDARASDAASSVPIYRRLMSSALLRPRWLPSLAALDAACRRERPSAIVVSHVLPMGNVARIIGQKRSIPYAVIVHGFDVTLAVSHGGRKLDHAKRALANAALVVANSGYTAHLVAGLCDAAKVVVVHPSPQRLPLVSAGALAAARSGMPGFAFLSVARLVQRKGFDTAIAAVAELAKRRRDASLTIVGDGPGRSKLEALAAGLGVSGRVQLVGPLPPAALAARYAASDAFVMLPRMIGPDVEGFGIVYLEAASFGKPSIGTQSGGVSDAVVHGETGLLVAPDDPIAAADAMMRLIDDKPLRDRLGSSAKARLSSHFGWERAAATFSAALDAAIANHGEGTKSKRRRD